MWNAVEPNKTWRVTHTFVLSGVSMQQKTTTSCPHLAFSHFPVTQYSKIAENLRSISLWASVLCHQALFPPQFHYTLTAYGNHYIQYVSHQ